MAYTISWYWLRAQWTRASHDVMPVGLRLPGFTRVPMYGDGHGWVLKATTGTGVTSIPEQEPQVPTFLDKVWVYEKFTSPHPSLESLPGSMIVDLTGHW